MELKMCINWNEKLEMCSKLVSALHKNFPIDYTTALCTTIYKRIKTLHEYDITQIPTIVSPIILLKPKVPVLQLADEDYGLHKVCDIAMVKNNLHGTFSKIKSSNVIDNYRKRTS